MISKFEFVTSLNKKSNIGQRQPICGVRESGASREHQGKWGMTFPPTICPYNDFLFYFLKEVEKPS